MRRPVPTRHAGAAHAAQPPAESPSPTAAVQPRTFCLDRLFGYCAGRSFDDTVVCDQAVFTSVRSPMGEGYRIVARSAGVTRQEAADITRRAPSHGNLCLDATDAFGFVAFASQSDRFCVMFSRFAGTEHTARGGQRVHTMAVLLSPDQFEHWNLNPVRVLLSMARSNPKPVTPEGPGCDPVALPVSADPFPRHCPASFAPLATGITAHLLSDRHCILAGVSQPLPALSLAVECIPRGLRRSASMLAGVTYAPARNVTIAMVEGDQRLIQRSIMGHDVDWIDPAHPQPPDDHPSSHWVALVRQWVASGRGDALRAIAQRAEPDASPTDLDRLADMLNDLDRAGQADDDTRMGLHERYTALEPRGSLETDLRNRLIECTAPPPTPEPDDEPRTGTEIPAT